MPDDRSDYTARPHDHLVEPIFTALEGRAGSIEESSTQTASSGSQSAPESWWKRLILGFRSPRP
ncbi:hypothetical protein [Engelhardtia mirabilis]|uniref:hypothetical protein n=1 Tax=Engelhardtia mirabilis TaxID=2528011 RepID=UPI00119D1533